MTTPERYPHYARYGMTEVHRAGSWPPTWASTCSCGWQSAWRTSKRDAEDDGDNHTKLHNDLDLEDDEDAT